MIEIKNTPGEATTGFPFPLRTLLVVPNLDETDFAELLEGTLTYPVASFDTDAIIGHRFETVIVARAVDDSPLREDTRRALVDWINTEVMPRVRSGRRPVWL